METVRLIRDNLPPCDKARRFKETQASLEVQLALLVLKMHEEVAEIGKAMHDAEEYADLLTVMQELAHRNHVLWKDVIAARDVKLYEKGGFTKGKVMYRKDKQERLRQISNMADLSPDARYNG